MPLLSIIIANYNYGRFLESAIRSVLSQNVHEDIELIVCDAASTDNSVEVIKRYEKHIAWWCSEKDDGQSAAFNKGFSHARGKYLTWLNADDLLVPGSLGIILSAMKRYPSCEWFTGNFIRFEQTGSVVQVGWGPHWYPGWLQRPNSPIVVFGPTSFFAKNAYHRVGRIDESMHYVMDSDLWLRLMAAGVKQRRVRTLCWVFRMHESSKTAEFSDHVVSNKVASAMALELRRSEGRVGYRMSCFLRLLSLLLRCIDGSLIRKFMYELTLRNINQVKGLKI